MYSHPRENFAFHTNSIIMFLIMSLREYKVDEFSLIYQMMILHEVAPE